jgi:hypothetical protein
MDLFERDLLIGCSQDPYPVLSDGRATARVTFIAPAGLRTAPDVALIGATLVSLERDQENTNSWIAVVKPHLNEIEVKMTISFVDMTIVLPLTVAPKVNITSHLSGKVSEADFALYLERTGEQHRSGRDLDRDGEVNYRDDYIYTANYLANRKMRSAATATAPRK